MPSKVTYTLGKFEGKNIYTREVVLDGKLMGSMFVSPKDVPPEVNRLLLLPEWEAQYSQEHPEYPEPEDHRYQPF